MKKFLLFMLLCFSQINYGQGGEYNDVYPADVISPVFNGGGMEKFNEYINKEFDYSKVTKAGKLEAAFTIDEEGNVTNIRIVQILDIESATEFIRVLKKCPKWQPAKQNGKPFSVKIKYPLVFNIKPKPLDNVAETKETPENSNANEGKTTGGLSKFYDFINKNFHEPDAPGLKGKVIVSFVINEDGSIGDYKIVKDLGYGTATELIRVLKLTSGKWTPATKDGKPVKTPYTLPLSINIPSEN